MELLTCRSATAPLCHLRDRLFRSHLTRFGTVVSQSIPSLYSICKGILTACRIQGSWGDNRRCGSTFAATPDKASNGFFMMVMSPWAHVAAADADAPPLSFIVRLAHDCGGVVAAVRR
jgi:hypothetical protein